MNRIFKFFIFTIIGIFISYCGLIFYVKYKIDDLPNYEFFIDPRANVSIKVLDKQGQLIGVRGAYYGGAVYFNTVSPHLVNAIISIEDRNFYNHNGYDIFGIIRAMVINLKSGSVVQGASTLTQQLAKDLFFSAERSYTRKIKELLYAIKLEQNYSKQEILTLYLNRVYLGAGLYGVSAAAERYFGKNAKDLTISESAMIAGLLKAPSRYSPTNSFVKAEKRASVVLNAMYEAGYITQDELKNALNNPAQLMVTSSTGGGGYIADYTADEVSWLIGDYSQDLIVTASVDLNLQNLSDTLSEYFVNNQGKEYNFSQVAFIALDNQGQILAMTGGKSYQKSPYNRAVTALRQPGSAFKTFVYAAAFEAGYSPNNKIYDEPVNYNGYQPTNYTDDYKGEMSLRTAYIQSINTVAVKLAHQVGIGRVINLAYRAGITRELPRYLSVALGATELSLLELTNAYVPFYNGGYAYTPSIIVEIRNSAGDILYQKPKESYVPPITSPDVLDKIKDISASNVAYGTGKKAQIKDVAVYGKTGTTSNYRDAWFIGHAGLTDGITAGVWLGNDDTSVTKKATGGGVATVLWQNILENYIYNHNTALIQKALPAVETPKLLENKNVEEIVNQLNERQKNVTEPKQPLNEPLDIINNQKPSDKDTENMQKNSQKEIKSIAQDKEKFNIPNGKYDDDRIENFLRNLSQ